MDTNYRKNNIKKSRVKHMICLLLLWVCTLICIGIFPVIARASCLKQKDIEKTYNLDWINVREMAGLMMVSLEDDGEMGAAPEAIPPASGATYELNGIYFCICEDANERKFASIYGYDREKIGSNVVISDKLVINTYEIPVERVENGAFLNASVQKIVFPASINYFGNNVLQGCTKLDIVQNKSSAILFLPINLEREGYFFRYWRNSQFRKIEAISSGTATTVYTNYKYTLVFNSNGGSSVGNVTAFAYQCAKEPQAPVKEGCTFEGWYTSPIFKSDTKWNFQKNYKTYTTTVTLYAKWETVNSQQTSIAKVTGLKVKTRKEKRLVLTWKKSADADGYQIYMYNKKSGEYVLYHSVSGSKTNTATVYGLSQGSVYHFKVRAYQVVNGSRTYGEFSNTLNTVTKPGKPSSLSLKSTKKKQIQVSFRKTSSCTGYEIQVSTSKSFSKKNTKTYKISKSTTKKTIKSLKTKKKYYVRMRAYTIYKNVKYYGAYTAKKTITCK